MKTLNLLGIDLGASQGRAFCGSFDGETLSLREIHRFPNGPVNTNTGSYWDILGILNEVRNCVLKTRAESIPISALAIDGWSQDFGLLDSQGNLLSNPHTYRDSRTDGILEEVEGQITGREIFNKTGMQPFSFCTLFQLIAMKRRERAILEKADKLLFIPNLLSFLIAGSLNCDTTLASVSLLYSPFTHHWIEKFLSRFDLPQIMPSIRDGSGVIGEATGSFLQDTGLHRLPLISVMQHDTASSVFAAPVEEMGEIVFLSSGTWSVLGTMVSEPVINDEAYRRGFSNELTYDRRTMLLQNITGLWILQECAREWSLEGYEIDYEYMEEKAASSQFDSFIDPDYAEFARPGNMAEKIARYCRESGQFAPRNKEETYQCILHGLACRYAQGVQELEQLAGKKYSGIYICGGGARSRYLCRQAARLTCMKVVAGASQATVIGNLISQLIVLGEIRDRSQALEVMQRSFPISMFQP
jgi:rhamnulokinase